MKKAELVDQIAKKAGMTKVAASKTLDITFNEIILALARGEKIRVPDFGTFEVRRRAPRSGKNPRTGKPMSVPATKAPAFKAAKKLKEKVAKK
jgi:DNA-binding protein HU-beta